MGNPIISVIVPCYNQAQYLPDALRSVLAQRYHDWECIIVNDGSPDNTEEVALEWCRKDSRFLYHKKENGGVSSSRNEGIKRSSGEYILPLDADDLIEEKYLERAIDRFISVPDTKLVYCKAEFFGSDIGEWDLEEYNFEKLLFNNMIFCSAVFRKEDFNKTNGYNENLREGLEDWDFWLSLLNESDIVYKIPSICFYYRIRQNSRNKSLTEQMVFDLKREIFKSHQEKYKNHITELIWDNPHLKEQQLTILNLNDEIKRIHATKAYRLGKLLLKPFSFLRNRINYKN